eukprot:245971-Pelagomonas_calceolata.AAC.1
MIDHRVTAPNHPQADGWAERAVQPVKRALRKVCEASATPSLRDNVMARAQLAQKIGIIAGKNLKIAQHRDTLRYATIRSG